MSKDLTPIFDVLIAGGGMAGTLAAHRLSYAHPKKHFMLVEKEVNLGGRLVSFSFSNEKGRNSALSGVSEELFHFIKLTIANNPEEDTFSLPETPCKSLGILSSKTISTVKMDDLLSESTAKIFGGQVVVREWAKISSQILSNTDENGSEDSLGKIIKEKKNPSLILLENIASICGIDQIWAPSLQNLRARFQYIQNGLVHTNWGETFNHILKLPSENLRCETLCLIIEAKKVDGIWHVKTQKGEFKARALLVAQSPWEAIEWLEMSDIPPVVLQPALKTKPLSVVTLACLQDLPSDLPDLLYLPAEGVLISPYNGVSTFHTVLSFEQSLEANLVTKAIKSLQRAKSKTLSYLNQELTKNTKNDHIGLSPIAWTQPTSAQDWKYFSKLGQDNMQSGDLAFCGDAYGHSFNPDSNLIKSVLSAVNVLGQSII